MIARLLRRLTGLGVPAEGVARGRGVADAALVDTLPAGPERAAAWKAYALQTYGNRLLDRCGEVLPPETARVVAACFDGATQELPRWATAARSRAELAAMRDTLEALRADLGLRLDAGRLAEVDAERRTVDLLWIERPPEELRAGLARHLAHGLDRAFALGAEAAGQLDLR